MKSQLLMIILKYIVYLKSRVKLRRLMIIKKVLTNLIKIKYYYYLLKIRVRSIVNLKMFKHKLSLTN